jgi:hypothetical protein
MQYFVPIASVILALFAAGCVAFLAWELTKEAEGERPSNEDDES